MRFADHQMIALRLFECLHFVRSSLLRTCPMPPLTPIPSSQVVVTEASHRWFAEKVEPHRTTLRRWLQSRFPRLSDIDDVAQEAVLKLWKRYHQTDTPCIQSPKSLLFCIARNTALDRARRETASKTDTMAEMERLHLLAEDTDVVQIVNSRQEMELLIQAIGRLPNRCRQVITLTKIYGLSEREVSKQLGVAESTVRTNVVRGLERLDEYFVRRGIGRKER